MPALDERFPVPSLPHNLEYDDPSGNRSRLLYDVKFRVVVRVPRFIGHCHLVGETGGA